MPTGPLARSLALLSRQAGIDVGSTEPAARRTMVRAIRGRYRPADALRHMLDGTPFIARRTGGVWTVAMRQDRLRALPRPVPIAAPPPPVEPATIVVIGAKRAATLRDFPGSVSRLDRETLENIAGVSATDALIARLVGLESTNLGPGRNKLFLRGVIDSGFVGPSQSTTGQYLDENRVNYNAPDPDLRIYDVERVELLSGPQATLYGAGSLGGVIRVSSVRPDPHAMGAAMSAGVATTMHGSWGGDVSGMINLPLRADAAALRVVGYATHIPGYVDAPAAGRSNVNDVRIAGGRAAIRLLADDWTIDAQVIGQRIDAGGSQWTDAGRGLVRSSPVDLPFDSRFAQGGLTFARQFGDIALVSATSAGRQDLTERYDASFLKPRVVTQALDSRMIAHETRLSRGEAGQAGWLAGISIIYSRSHMMRQGHEPDGTTTPRQSARTNVQEETLFGEVSRPLPLHIMLTAGGRLTTMRVSGMAWSSIEASNVPIMGHPVEARGARTHFRAMPSGALSRRIGKEGLLYLRYQQGFRPGGFGVSGIIGSEYRGDRMASIEAGARMTTTDDRLELQLSASHAIWRDVLAEVVTEGGDPVTRNIGDGRIRTLEGQIAWRPSDGLRLSAAAYVNDAQLHRPLSQSVALKDNRLPNVPVAGGQAAIEDSIALPGGQRLSGIFNIRYHGAARLGAGPELDVRQGDYWDSYLSVWIGNDRRRISLTATNLLDSAANRYAFASPYRIFDAVRTPQEPRSIRIGFEHKF
ncbi:TonB-dependent receptor [Sphingobium sp.]|uniref:TonB-dependent receptor n=1 Tax=Sphingobium sp. TaxID=1912891 RepID=UPI003B3ACDAA